MCVCVCVCGEFFFHNKNKMRGYMEVKVSFIFLFLSASSVLNEDEDDDGWNKQTNMCVCVCNLSKEVKRESHIFISYVCIFAYQIVTTKKGREKKKKCGLYVLFFSTSVVLCLRCMASVYLRPHARTEARELLHSARRRRRPSLRCCCPPSAGEAPWLPQTSRDA